MPARTAADLTVDVPTSEHIRGFERYLVLVKARLTGLVVFTTAVGYLVATTGSIGDTLFSAHFALALLGTALAAGGANGLNQVAERDRDRLMRRTRVRPLPTGTMGARHGLVVSTVLAVAGPILLAIATNLLTAALAALTVALYVFVYTPLKTRSPLCTLVGAVCGAIPPMMGVTAVTNAINAQAWILFGLLFVWQIPHFLALAWWHRDDYARGGFRMLPLVDRTGARTCISVWLYALALVPVGFAATMVGVAGWASALGSVVLGIWFARRAWHLYSERTTYRARRVFLASLIYLPALLILMVADRGPAAGIIPWQTNTMRVVGVADVPTAE